ncbi:hypothetical protein DL240_09535 [Lujinxingia litoralis]|uniref:Pyridoxamine 5'-phosphate oxidase Alr4036 family FMN-binding domain-containing protein n=1 Tax=Lujinxingia litoralis TaxID=2211119 RepID=A0A328C926_9DELT|nr:pyridoxamine 5'-phosphate oxidase family protein [Lujinxingia litoralis]RAL23114.1 hypothetical protein DL240_09535 [Lujinxingia litoralis]
MSKPDDDLLETSESTPRYTSLDEVLAHLWSYAARGARYRDNAMATPIFVSTAVEGGPSARTVVLREVEEGRALLCHTDRRSRKVAELAEEPRSIWVTYDRQEHQQFQFIGRSSVHTDDDVADRMWAEESPDELVFYFKRSRPSEGAAGPTSAQDFESVSEDEARGNFAVVRTEIEAIMWQHVHPEGEYRARFEWDGGRWVGTWLIP